MTTVVTKSVLEVETGQKPVGNKHFCSDGWGTRHTMAMLAFVGFGLSYAMRVNLSIAIVPMVNRPKISEHLSNMSIQDNSSSHDQPLCQAFQKFSNSAETDLTTNLPLEDDLLDENNPPIFAWTEREQGLVLGSFFWGYVLTQYPGGWFAQIYGAKWVLSLGILLTAILSILTPVVTQMWGKYGLIVIRVLQGLGGGVTFPAMNVLLAKWSPRGERSRMTSLVFSGIPVGTALTMVIGGYLIHYFQWPSLFYSIGCLTLIWFVLWTILIYNCPSQHPWIGQEELAYIQESIGDSGLNCPENAKTPWREIFRSLPVISIFIVHVGHCWGHYFIHTEVPKYLHTVQNFKIQHTGWFSALPQFLNGMMSIISSNLSDFLIVREYTSVIFTRKLCATVALWGSTASFLGVILGGCDTIVAVTFLNVAGAVLGAGFSGWIVNLIDIAPNHVGPIMGIANGVANCFAFIAPFITGLILHSDPTILGWRIAFLIPAVINFTVNIFFLIFASSTEQPWNRMTSKPSSI